jgi:hypothetical protein
MSWKGALWPGRAHMRPLPAAHRWCSTAWCPTHAFKPKAQGRGGWMWGSRLCAGCARAEMATADTVCVDGAALDALLPRKLPTPGAGGSASGSSAGIVLWEGRALPRSLSPRRRDASVTSWVIFSVPDVRARRCRSPPPRASRLTRQPLTLACQAQWRRSEADPDEPPTIPVVASMAMSAWLGSDCETLGR